METYKNILAQLNETIWDSAELKFCEHKSANAMTELLKAEGFTVVKGIADMETSYTASYGSGHPIIGILGEYDALSGLSQQADVAVRTPREGTECGHGCGHNLLGTAAVGAALYLRDYLKESQK
ncbi:MAG: amidohydrolase, partial [Oscillospiraceae bacterium]